MITMQVVGRWELAVRWGRGKAEENGKLVRVRVLFWRHRSVLITPKC